MGLGMGMAMGMGQAKYLRLGIAIHLWPPLVARELGGNEVLGNRKSVAGASTWNGGTGCDRNTDSPKAKANQYTYVRLAGIGVDCFAPAAHTLCAI